MKLGNNRIRVRCARGEEDGWVRLGFGVWSEEPRGGVDSGTYEEFEFQIYPSNALRLGYS